MLAASYLRANHDLALSLLRQTPVSESTVFSPLSFAIALSVLFVGAKDKTRLEIGNVLLNNGYKRYSEKDIIVPEIGDRLILENFGALMQAIKRLNGVHVLMGTRLYLAANLDLKNGTFNQTLHETFHGDRVRRDFKRTQYTANIMNAYASRTTDGALVKICEEKQLRDAMAVLINICYFKGYWIRSFMAGKEPQAFFSSRSSYKLIPMMKYPRDWLWYAENERLRMVKLEYWDAKGSTHQNVTMAIILPKKRFGLAELRDRISSYEIVELLTKPTLCYVDLFLPKFRLETNWDTTKVVQKLGIHDAFDAKADFSSASSAKLVLSQMIHKSLLQVNEAATSAGGPPDIDIFKGTGDEYPDKPIIFRADEPFLVYVTLNDHPLFLGQFTR